MDLAQFKAGVYEKQYEYKSFLPNRINQGWIISDPPTQTLLEEANLLLGELKAYSEIIPDIDFFIQMHIRKEATTSSRIEGTKTNMEEAFIEEKDVDPERRNDWREVRNYIEAMNSAIVELGTIPLSNRLLKNAHRVLMQGVRGEHKRPGEFRTSQNWIGPSLKHATYVPPHYDKVTELMSDLEKFIHNEDANVPHLVKIAMLHYQFETIHPFCDGNGRIGRLMITLYLVNFDLLSKPALYLSDFFERNKGEYYDNLMAVRTRNHMMAWIRFFLFGVKETAGNSIQVLKDILTIKERIEREKLPHLHSRKQDNAGKLMKFLYSRPIVSVNAVSQLLNVQHNTAASLVKDFEKFGILEEWNEHKRNRLYIFGEYIKLF